MSTATITSAIKLSETQKKNLESVLHKKYQVTKIKEVIDPTIFGGLKVTIGSKQIDLSVKNRLDKLRT